MNKIEQLNCIIKDSNNIVFFGGAGVSVASGIPDFRSSSGIYNEKSKYPPEEILSHTFFHKHTDEFYKFYKSKMIYKHALPNDAHLALSELEKQGKLKAIITQNIDGLHQMAGSKNVLELHGSIHRNYCLKCLKAYDLNFILNSNNIPKCKCGEIVKPDVVLYEEGLDEEVISKAIYYIENAEVLIVGGTSLTVHPAASLVSYFKGKHFIIINKSSTPYDIYADLIINDDIDKVLRNI